MQNTERELKMLLTKEEYETILRLANTEPQLQVNHYFYCDQMPADIMLRIREKCGKYMFCYKRLLSNANGINVCDERETELNEETAKRIIADGLTPAEIKRLVDVETDLTFKCVGSLRTYRAKFLLENWTIELDKNEYLQTVDYELECECASNELLNKLKEYLLRNYGITFRPSVSKSARFFKRLFSD